MHLTFIGLGNMGAQLVRAHLKAGAQCTIWNRSPKKQIVTDLQEAGASYEGDVEKAITASDVLVICLPDHETIYKCLDALPSHSEDEAPFSTPKFIVNLSNGSPKDAENMDTWFKERQASVYVSAAIMAGPDNIGDHETSFILYSGEIPSDLNNDVESVLSPFGKTEYVGRAVRNAQLNNNASLAATYSLFAGALLSSAILSQAADASGGSGEQKGRILKPFQSYVAPLLKPAAGELDGLIKSVEDGNEDAQGASISMIGASLRNLSKTCKELNVDPGGVEHLWKLCDEMMNDGEGSKGMQVLVKKLISRT